MSVISTWGVLTELSNLRVEHLVMCAWRGSSEHSFAPMSLLICFCAAWPSLGKVSPLKADPSADRQRGKKHFQPRLSGGDSREESGSRSLSSHNSKHSENLSHGFVWLRAFMSCAFHLLIAKNGNGFQKCGSDERRSLFSSIQQRLI